MTKRMRAVLTACLGAGLAFLPNTAIAQAVYGSIYGTVTDASGAAIPGATGAIVHPLLIRVLTICGLTKIANVEAGPTRP